MPDTPGLFATYPKAAADSHAAVEAHVAELRAQPARIIQAGATEGSFAPRDPHRAADATLNAISPFHHPLFLCDLLRRGAAQDAEAAISLLLAGLCAQG